MLFLLSLFACRKELGKEDLNVGKSKSSATALPKSIKLLCSDVIDPDEAKVNDALYDIFNSYILSYGSSSNIRSEFQNEIILSTRRNVLFSNFIKSNNSKKVFFWNLSLNASTGVKTCEDLNCINPYFSYKNYDYEVLITYFNKSNPNIVFGNSLIFALGQDFYHPTDEFEDVIPGVMLEYRAGHYYTSEIGVSEEMANSTNTPLFVFNFHGIGDTLEDKYPEYGNVIEPDSIITDKSQFFALYATTMKINYRFESSNYSEFRVGHMNNYCCASGWGSADASVDERHYHNKIHKSKVGNTINVNWHQWTYNDYNWYNPEYWWSKFCVYEYDWWAGGKSATPVVANGTGTMNWYPMVSRFKHEWYLGLKVFKNDVLFPSNGTTLLFSTTNGAITLKRM